MPKVTWLGDDDDTVESIRQHGHTFPKGKAVHVDAKDRALPKFEHNICFKVEADK